MNDTNTRTPQPGDVWRDDFTGQTWICWVDLGNATTLFPAHDCSESETIDAEDVTDSPDGWAYLGRASDLIVEALAKREEHPQ